jgi:tetratricopeptide (TPR) repeat protein
MSFPPFSTASRIFFSYATSASKDKNLLNKLRAHLSSLRRQGLIDEWYDSAISTRGDVGQIIETYINKANIIVLLISADFLNSKRCYEVEMKRALELRNAGEAQVIPVLLRPTIWDGSPLDQYSLLPPDGKPVSLWSDPDAALVEVAKGIRKVVEELAKFVGVRSRSEIQFPLDNIPHRHNQFFTDRKALLNILHNYFTISQTFPQTRIQALNGLGGVGKTQIAVEYAYRYKHEYQAVLWLKAASRDLLCAEIVSLAELLSLSEQDQVDEQRLFTAVKRWLQRHDRWLLILDNLEDFNLINLFIPLQGSGHVLLTTLTQATGHIAHAVMVAQMETDDSVLFLLRRAKIIEELASRDEASEADNIQAELIAQEVGGLPLALDQAGAYIEETHCSLARYLARYRQRRVTLLGQRGRFADDHPESVAVTLSLAFEKVAQERPEALKLLRLFAFLHPDAIPDEMIVQGAPALDGPLHVLAADPFALDEAIAILLKFSLVQRRTDTTVLSIHRIVQAILIDGLTIKQQRQWAIRVVRLVNCVFPEADFSNWSACERYLSQAQRCAELITNFHLTQKEVAHLLLRLGSYCYQRACYHDAEKYLTHALRLCEEGIGPEHLNTAQILNNLALLYNKQGKYQEAEALYHRALVIRERVLGPDHSKVAQALNNLALLYMDQGRYQQAETLYQRVLSIDERTVGPNHPGIAITLNNLALVYYKQGKYALAESLYQRVISIEERKLSANDPGLAFSLNNLAVLYEAQGNSKQAEVLYRRALAIREQSVGPEHPDMAQSLNNLAYLYMARGDYLQANVLYQRALIIYERVLSPEHPEIAKMLNNLAYLSRQQGQYNLAETLYQRALTIHERMRGAEHPETANVLNNLGWLYHLMKNDERAEPLLRRALRIREQVLGPEHPDTAGSLNCLAELLTHQQQYDLAEPLFQRALAIRQQAFGPGHPGVVLVLENYATLLKSMNRIEEAIILQQTIQFLKNRRV